MITGYVFVPYKLLMHDNIFDRSVAMEAVGGAITIAATPTGAFVVAATHSPLMRVFDGDDSLELNGFTVTVLQGFTVTIKIVPSCYRVEGIHGYVPTSVSLSLSHFLVVGLDSLWWRLDVRRDNDDDDDDTNVSSVTARVSAQDTGAKAADFDVHDGGDLVSPHL
ncbi:hypothetical protein L1887_15820 [Cichorium endivia]|nr:hypothetical protein L1887_15820 [Cichorium endivia]